MFKEAREQAADVFFDPTSIFSQSLAKEFRSKFTDLGGQIRKEFNLSDPSFRGSTYLNQAQTQDPTALVIFPDANINPQTFDNAIELIKANKGRYWMMGGNTVYSPKTLRFAGQEALDHLVVVVPWHHLSSPNREFPQTAEKLWGGEVSSRTALTYDAARALIRALENSQPSRTSVQKALANPSFEADGATGKVSFEPTGNRKERVAELVKVVPSRCSPYGFRFIPINYPADRLQSLERCKLE